MYEINVFGIVQGVGFRPFIYNNAIKNNLVGTVQNTNLGVRIICENKDVILKILKNPPPLSKIEKIEVKKFVWTNCPPQQKKFLDFKILKSINKNSYSQIPADLNICKDCFSEIFDENKKRRFNHPFISCTNCGPRYSCIISSPYDRENTSFKEFKMCKDCKKEYRNPENRRYHAQSICCNNCGPKLSLYEKEKDKFKKINCENEILKISNLIKKGEVVSIKGIGGFALVCKMSEIEKLKKITKRKYKPFALIGKNLNQIKKYCHISKLEEKILISKIRPIVLLEKKDKNKFKKISELSSLGFLLPYTPIHHLILNNFDEPLIYTSSNLPNHPISSKLEEQFTNYILDYNRKIINKVDDSIIKIIDNEVLIIRRARGIVLNEIEIPKNYRTGCGSFLAFGSEMKNTFAIKKKSKIILSEHIGNIYNLENYFNYKKKILKLIDFTKTKIDIVLSDENFKYNSSIFAKEFSEKNNLKNIKIQHHIAHSFSIAFEYNLVDFFAIICDGTGFGTDENTWGGEVFYNDKRVGHLEYQILIGGDISNKEPVRMLIGILSEFLSLETIKKIICGIGGKFVTTNEISIFIKQKEENFNCIKTSSCSRILDCISILLGFSNTNFYEGRGAMLLESNSSKKVELYFKPIIEFDKKTNLYILKTTPLFEFVIKNLNIISKEDLARFSQIYLAKGLYDIAKKSQKKLNENLPILFGGGCAYNSTMTQFMLKNNLLLNKEIPCGDGGISVGQIAYYLWKERKK